MPQAVVRTGVMFCPPAEVVTRTVVTGFSAANGWPLHSSAFCLATIGFSIAGRSFGLELYICALRTFVEARRNLRTQLPWKDAADYEELAPYGFGFLSRDCQSETWKVMPMRQRSVPNSQRWAVERGRAHE